MNRNTLDVQGVMAGYQAYILSGDAHALRGSMDWSAFYVDDACPDPADPYAICASDPWYGPVVTEFVAAMAAKA